MLIHSIWLTLLTVPSAAPGDSDWPQWRGPNRTGMAAGPAWPASLAGLKQSWRLELGPGYPGPIVVGGKVFVCETQDEMNEVVRAVDRVTGKEIWRQSWPGAMKVPFFARENGDWIRATPACDGESLYVAGMCDKLVCLDADTGEIRWDMDFVKEWKKSLPAFGFVCSPLVVDDGLYVHAGGAFCKLDKKSGEVLWKTLDDGGGMFGGSFSSPVMETLGGKKQLLVQTRTHLAGVDPQSGSVLWKQEVPAFRGMNILTPTVYRDGVFTSSYQRNTWLYRVGGAGGEWSAAQSWENKLKGYMSSPVLIDGYVYMHLQNQRLASIAAETGEIAWITSRRFGKYWSMVANGTRILCLDETGELFLMDADPKEFRLLDEKRLSDEETWGHLAVSGRDLFVRELKAISAWRWD